MRTLLGIYMNLPLRECRRRAQVLPTSLMHHSQYFVLPRSLPCFHSHTWRDRLLCWFRMRSWRPLSDIDLSNTFLAPPHPPCQIWCCQFLPGLECLTAHSLASGSKGLIVCIVQTGRRRPTNRRSSANIGAPGEYRRCRQTTSDLLYSPTLWYHWNVWNLEFLSATGPMWLPVHLINVKMLCFDGNTIAKCDRTWITLKFCLIPEDGILRPCYSLFEKCSGILVYGKRSRDQVHVVHALYSSELNQTKQQYVQKYVLMYREFLRNSFLSTWLGFWIRRIWRATPRRENHWSLVFLSLPVCTLVEVAPARAQTAAKEKPAHEKASQSAYFLSLCRRNEVEWHTTIEHGAGTQHCQILLLHS